MKNQKRFRVLTFIGVFALLSISLSSCFYGGYGYNNNRGYYGRPSYGYGYGYARPQVRVYSQPRYNYHHNNDGYRRGNGYGGGNGGYRGGNSRGRR